MISESEIIRRIRISDLGSANKSYADEVIEKYKIVSKTRLQYPTKTFKWVIDNQSYIADVNDRTIQLGGRGTPYFDRIEFMIRTENEVMGFLGSKYNKDSRQMASRKTFWEMLDMRISGNPKFSGYNAQLKKDEEQILAEKLKEEQRQNELRIKQFVSKPVIITPKVVAPKVVEPKVVALKVVKPKVVEPKVADPIMVASSSLLPLGIIGLLLYTSMGKK